MPFSNALHDAMNFIRHGIIQRRKLEGPFVTRSVALLALAGARDGGAAVNEEDDEDI